MNDLITHNDPKSYLAETIKTVRTNLLFSSVDNKLKTILITSTEPGEGKSFIASNLAVAFAQSGSKVLLVDCDLRKGRQHEIFGLSNKIGLSSLLISDGFVELELYIRKTKIDNLYVIPIGITPPNPLELLSSESFDNFLETVKHEFDLIILDAAPVSKVSDALVLSKDADKTIVVAAFNQTEESDLNETLKSLKNVGAKVAGVVLNKKVISKKTYYGKYYKY